MAKPSRKSEIAAWFRSNPGEHASAEVISTTGLGKAAVSKYLGDLVREKEIVRIKQGVYMALTEAETSGYERKRVAAATTSKRRVRQKQPDRYTFSFVAKLDDTSMLVRSVDTGHDFFVLRGVNI